MPLNILDVDFTFPDTSYILAPGKLGASKWRSIPHNAFVICVNYGIEIPNVHKHIWMAEDRRLPELYGWFKDAAREYINKSYLLHEPYPTPVFDSGYMYQLYPNIPYTYNSGPSMGNPPSYCLIDGLLRGGLTIAFKAIQLAVFKGSKRIVLCGVDMMGNKYFDDKETKSGMNSGGEDEPWWCLYKWERALLLLQKQGVEVVSLSKTALKVPVIGG